MTLAEPAHTGKLISFTSEDRELEGYLVRPATLHGPQPGLLIIHEIFGLNDNLKAVAEKFAAAGYVALAVDLFANQNKAACMARMLAGVFADSLDHPGVRDTRAALGVLGALPGVDPSRLGAVGFCLGGSLAIALACTDERVKAVAPYYGFNPRPLGAVRRACPVVGSTGQTRPPGRAGRWNSPRRRALRTTSRSTPAPVTPFPTLAPALTAWRA